MKRVLLVVVALVAGAACVPSRDNPFDPQNAPAAELAVADAGPAVAGECPAVLSSSLLPVAFVSRGRCIVLDASGTSNPKNDELTFQFRLPPAGGTTTPQLVVTAVPTLPLTGTYRRQLPVETQLTFEIAVSTNGGRSFGASASASVVLTNAPPVAVTDVSRSLRVGGLPWSLGTPFDVAFDASGSVDPDGDFPLQYCWTFPGESESCTGEAVVRRTVPVTRGRTLASLRVTDNLDDSGVRLSSRRVPATVSVTDPVLWHSPFTRIQRIDTLRPVDLPFNTPREGVRYPETPATQSAMLVFTEDAAPGSGSPGATLRLVDEATGVVGAGSVFVPDNVEAIAADPARNRIWTLSVIPGATPASKLRAWSIPAPMTISADASVPVVSLTIPAAGAYAGILQVAANGNVWVSSLLSRYLYEVSPAGVILATHEFPGRSVREAAIRPGTQDLWVVFDADLYPDGVAISGSALAIYSMETGTLLRAPFPLGNVAVSEIAWIDTDQLWISLIVDGLRVVDAEQLQGGADVEGATITRIDDLAQVYGLVVDEGTGALWCSGSLDGLSRTFRATPAGDFDLFDAPATLFGTEVFYVEPGGALWWTDAALPGRLVRSTAFDPAGTVVSVDLPGQLGAVDSTTGWLWYPLDLPPSLLQITGEGAIRRFVRTVEIGGVEQIMPTLRRLRVEPGGTALWGLADDFFTGTTTVYRIDRLDSDVPRATVATTFPSFAPTIDTAVLEPGPLASEFLWTLSLLPNPDFPHVAKLTTNGLTNTFDVPEDTRRAYAARSPSTGSLCLVSEDQTALKRVRVRWIKPDGVVSLIDQFDLDAVVPNYNLSAVGMSVDQTNGEVCWVVLRSDNSCSRDGPTEIRGYRQGSAVPFRTHVVTGRATSSSGSGFEFRALSGDELVLGMTRDCTIPGGIDERLRLSWNGSGFSESRVPLIDASSFMFVD